MSTLDLSTSDLSTSDLFNPACAVPAAPSVTTGSAERICQLIGDIDRASMMPTINLSYTRYMLSGTDLGASFEHQGKLYFLFGDSRPTAGNPVCGDAVATTTATDPSACIPLTFLAQVDGNYRSPAVPGVDLG